MADKIISSILVLFLSPVILILLFAILDACVEYLTGVSIIKHHIRPYFKK